MNYIVTKNPEFFQNIGKYNCISIQEFGAMIAEVKGMAADSETTGLDARKDKLFAIQFGTGKDNFIIDLQDYSSSLRFKEYEGLTQNPQDIWPFIREKHLVFHNGKFDLGFWMMSDFIPDPEFIWDTMIASQIKYNGKPWILHNLADTMKREIGVTIPKDERKNIHIVKLSTAASIEYCFNDVDKLKHLHTKLFDDLKAYGSHQTYHLQRKFLCPLVYMELCGLPLNKYKWNQKIEQDKLEYAMAKQAVKQYIWDNLPKYRKMQMNLFEQDIELNVKLSSPAQMIPVFRDLGINVEVDDKEAHTKKPKKRETPHQKSLRERGKKESIEKDVLSLSTHEFVPIWIRYTDAEHTLNNFGQNILDKIEDDNRIYLRFRPMVDTSRIASSKESAMNGLNIPAKANTRECFEATPGFKMVVCDFEGQENVILADKSEDEVMLDSVINGKCLHCAYARLAFPEIAHLSDKEIKKNHADKRSFVKAPRFLKAYGGSAYTMAKQCGMSTERAEFLSEQYDILHPGVTSWGLDNLAKNTKKGYIESALGWRLALPRYEEFMEHAEVIDNMTDEDTTLYRKGKKIHIALKEYKDTVEKLKEQGLPVSDTPFVITDKLAYEYYLKIRPHMKRYFQLQGEYHRLTLNNPIQTTGAHMTKLALVMLYIHIVERGHIWLARLSNSPYDEIVMEVKDELVEEYVPVLQNTMREAANKFLYSGKVKMGADAAAGTNWESAKHPA